MFFEYPFSANAARFMAKSASSSRAVWNLPFCGSVFLNASGWLMSNSSWRSIVRSAVMRVGTLWLSPWRIRYPPYVSLWNESSAERAAPRPRKGSKPWRTSLNELLNWFPAVVKAPRAIARSTSAGSDMSLGMYCGNLAWNRIFGFSESFFHTRPMCTASALCIGMNGDTRPHSAGGQLALGSGNEDCAEAPDQRPRASHDSAQMPPAANVTICLFIAGPPVASVRRGSQTCGQARRTPWDRQLRFANASFLQKPVFRNRDLQNARWRLPRATGCAPS